MALKTVGMSSLGRASSAIKNIQNKNTILTSVNLELIDFDTEQYRQNKDRYQLEKLAMSIRKHGGLIQNPNYELKPDGRYLVLTGEMRTRAYMLLKELYPNEKQWNAIDVRVRELKELDGLSLQATRKLFQFAENDEAQKPNIFDRAQGLVELFNVGGKEAVQIALNSKNLKSSAAEVSKWKSLSKVNVSIREDILDHNIEDKDTIITLGKIVDKKPGEFKKLMTSFKDKTLGTSIAKASQNVWATIKKANAKKSNQVKNKASNEEVVTKPQNIKQSGMQEIIATDVNFNDGSLVIKTQNGTEMKFVFLEKLAINIDKNVKN